MKQLVVLSLFFVMLSAKHYELKYEPIDVVMPCHEKDLLTLNACIEGIRRNVSNVRRIIVVSEKKLTDEAEWFDESQYPFNKMSVAYEIFHDWKKVKEYLANPKNRAGWIMKQIFNFYHFRVIPNLSSNVLVVDCDTIFLKPVEFLTPEGGGLYSTGTEYHEPYFIHAKKLIPGFEKLYQDKSGIVHHHLFQQSIMEDMLQVIENFHKKEAWKAICNLIDINEIFGSAISDYELYFNFAFANTDQVKIRELKWTNSDNFNISRYQNAGFDFASFHAYLRT